MNDPDAKEFKESGLPSGRGGGGESGGGAYPNPHSGKEPDKDGFMGRGGQTGMDYHGGENPNAPAGGGSADAAKDEGDG